MCRTIFFIVLICLMYINTVQSTETINPIVPRSNWWITTVDGKEYVGFVGKHST